MRSTKKNILCALGWAYVLALPIAWGCGSKPAAPPADPNASSMPSVATPTAPAAPATPSTGATSASTGPKKAVAKITSTSDGGITGEATFVATGDQVEVSLSVDKAPPGQRAWHIHDGKSCGREKLADGGMGAPGTAAGPHWNPKKVAHGMPGAAMHHPGDFGNFTVDAKGKGTAKLTATGFNLDDTGELSAVGHALIIHGGTDNGMGDNGDAGPRVGCGIIERQ